MRRLIIVIAVIALGAFILSGCSKEDSGKKVADFNPTPRAGSPATDFLFRDMGERPFRLSEKKGSVVILYFWRLKCEECKAEMDTLEALYRRFMDRGLIVVAVGADNMHSAPLGQVQDFLEKRGFTFIVMRDSEGYVSEAYDVLKAPESVVIDKSGIIASVEKEPKDWASPDRVRFIESLLK